MGEAGGIGTQNGRSDPDWESGRTSQRKRHLSQDWRMNECSRYSGVIWLQAYSRKRREYLLQGEEVHPLRSLTIGLGGRGRSLRGKTEGLPGGRPRRRLKAVVTVERMEGLAQDIRGQGPLPASVRPRKEASTFWGLGSRVDSMGAQRGKERGEAGGRWMRGTTPPGTGLVACAALCRPLLAPL